MPNEPSFPLPFWLCCAVVLAGLLQGFNARQKGWGIPMIGVLGTVSVWYIGDVIYNDYLSYMDAFGLIYLENAWWQVLLFLIAFCTLVPLIHEKVNRSLMGRASRLMQAVTSNALETPSAQLQITRVFNGLAVTWIILTTIAFYRVRGDWIGLFAPYLGHKADPWSRDRIGGGIDAFIALAGYLQIFLTASIGIIAALARHPSTVRGSLILCLLSFPYFWFDRTRNTMLATTLPGLLAFVGLRLKGGLLVKLGTLAGLFLVVNFWFSFIMANRNDASIAYAVTDASRVRLGAKHEGLNMYEELCWVNKLIDEGKYRPNWGARYFAEMVNPIPRVLWPGKPLIGIDYAEARGQGGGGRDSAGVYATISTGMIGQGVVNFGIIVGPIFAALLMAFWVALLARQDLLGEDTARLLLYACGLVLTFNMGRDITLLVIYPFLFGMILFRMWKKFAGPTVNTSATLPSPGHKQFRGSRVPSTRRSSK